MEVEVAYATPEQQIIIPLQVEAECTVKQGIEASGILKQFPEIDLNKHAVGIFSKRAKLDTVLREGDRVEIYRELLIDPKQRRINKAMGSRLECTKYENI